MSYRDIKLFRLFSCSVVLVGAIFLAIANPTGIPVGDMVVAADTSPTELDTSVNLIDIEDDDLVVMGESNDIVRYNVDGNRRRTTLGSLTVGGIAACAEKVFLAAASDGVLFIDKSGRLDSAVSARVGKIDAIWPIDVACSDGALYVLDILNRNIIMYNAINLIETKRIYLDARIGIPIALDVYNNEIYVLGMGGTRMCIVNSDGLLIMTDLGARYDALAATLDQVVLLKGGGAVGVDRDGRPIALYEFMPPGDRDITDMAINGNEIVVVDGSKRLRTSRLRAAGQSIRSHQLDSRCGVYFDKRSDQETIILGQSVEVDISAKALCEESAMREHMLLVFDLSASIAESRVFYFDTAMRFVSQYTTNPYNTDYSIYSFSSEASMERVTRRSTDLNEVVRGIEKISTTIGDGGTEVLDAMAVIADDIKAMNDVAVSTKVIVFSDGMDAGSSSDETQVRDTLSSYGVHVVLVPPIGQSDGGVVQRVASKFDLVIAPLAAPSLAAARYMRNILSLFEAGIDMNNRIETNDVLASDVEYLGMQVSSAPHTFSNGTIYWPSIITNGHFSARYLVRPLRPGRVSLNDRAFSVVEWRDNSAITLEYPIPVVEVIGITPTAPATSSPVLTEPPHGVTVTQTLPTAASSPATPTIELAPTQTSIPTLSVTATALAGLSPEPTTNAPDPVYLPIMISEACPPKDLFSDVVFVLDASSSMQQLASSGMPRIDEARQAIRSFTARLRMSDGGDRVAIVAYNSSGWLVQPLTSRNSDISRALGRIQTAVQSRMDLGIDVALAEIVRGGAAGRTSAMIVISDGHVNQVDPADVIRKAVRVRSIGSDVFCIAIGAGANIGLLRSVAGLDDHTLVALDAAELTRILRGITHNVICPPRLHWARR